MDIEKAIEILQLNLNEGGPKMPADVRDALIMAIKALRLCINVPTLYFNFNPPSLINGKDPN